MRNLILLLLFPYLLCSACAVQQNAIPAYASSSLLIQPLTKQVFVHITYLEGENGSKIPCNGMIYLHGKEAIVFDTPTTESTSAELINWVEKSAECRLKAVVINHFHNDCLGGIAAFHARGIPSYSNMRTIQLAAIKGEILPQNGFDSLLLLQLGNATVENRYFGEGHTADNIVSYLPDEEVLFGGCLVKCLGAGKGNLADANLAAWPQTVEKVKAAFPHLKYVIPGHGDPGNTALLDYTVAMFREDK